MKNHESAQQDWDQEKSTKRTSSRSRERKLMLEEEVRRVAEDDMHRAREIVMLRRELARLHYKVKTYHNQSRIVNTVVQGLIVVLLAIILYKLYNPGTPAPAL